MPEVAPVMRTVLYGKGIVTIGLAVNVESSTGKKVGRRSEVDIDSDCGWNMHVLYPESEREGSGPGSAVVNGTHHTVQHPGV